jgi:HSP20 family protein
MQLTKILPRSRRSHEIAPWDRDPFASLQTHINELFEDLPGGFGALLGEPSRATTNMRPRIDVSETPKEFLIDAEMPGVNKEDVEVTMPNPSTLVLRGQKKLEEKSEEAGSVHTERIFGSFYRAMTLGADIDVENVKARFEDGVLKVTCPKAAPAEDTTRKIEIES